MAKNKNLIPIPDKIRRAVFHLEVPGFLPGIYGLENGFETKPALKTKPWPDCWITVEGQEPYAVSVTHFRKSFRISEIPRLFIVHVAADNQYKLNISRHWIQHCPARDDLFQVSR